ncbi:MAG TPA: hypothetical protein VK694_00010 [Verrucomicrobiae bacterium]|nr:hypothetical protein [Verrucomicrobiae bacterium]
MALPFGTNNNATVDELTAKVTDLKRVQTNALRIVFNAREQLSRLLGIELLDGGPTTDFGGFQLVGQDIVVTVDPFGETVTFVDSAGTIPSVTFPAPNGRLSEPHQRMLIGLKASAERARETDVDPVSDTMSLAGVASSDANTLAMPTV